MLRHRPTVKAILVIWLPATSLACTFNQTLDRERQSCPTTPATTRAALAATAATTTTTGEPWRPSSSQELPIFHHNITTPLHLWRHTRTAVCVKVVTRRHSTSPAAVTVTRFKAPVSNRRKHGVNDINDRIFVLRIWDRTYSHTILSTLAKIS